MENDQLAFSKFQKMNLRDDLDTAYKAVEKTAAAVLSGPDSPAPNWHGMFPHLCMDSLFLSMHLTTAVFFLSCANCNRWIQYAELSEYSPATAQRWPR